jgi:transposase, IS5 family
MIVDRYTPMNVFALMPGLMTKMDPGLAELDALLEDDLLFQAVKGAMSQRAAHSATRGRPTTPVEVVLRMLVLRRRCRWSYRETVYYVGDSLVLRHFCRLYFQKVPDHSVLQRWGTVITPETVDRMGDRTVRIAVRERVTRGRKLRDDGTVVETTIHHPADNSLLADSVRVLSRLLGRAAAVVGEHQRAAPDGGGSLFRNRTRSAKRLARRISDSARRRGDEAKAHCQRSYRRLLDVTRASVRQARAVTALLTEEAFAALRAELERMTGLAERVIDQTRRRVVEGESVPASEKIVSIFEPHTDIIVRGKAGKPTEFGHKLWLSEVEGGILTRATILSGNPSDHDQVMPSIEHHSRLFGKPPDLYTADRGCWTPEMEDQVTARGVKQVAIPATGTVSPERRAHERHAWFRRAYRYRSGMEGRISVLKRREYLGRCPDEGEQGYAAWIGWGRLTNNLDRIAQVKAERRTVATRTEQEAAARVA